MYKEVETDRFGFHALLRSLNSFSTINAEQRGVRGLTTLAGTRDHDIVRRLPPQLVRNTLPGPTVPIIIRGHNIYNFKKSPLNYKSLVTCLGTEKRPTETVHPWHSIH